MKSRYDNMVGTTTAKDKITDPIFKLQNELIIYTRSFYDRINVVSMGMNTMFKVDSHFINASPAIYSSPLIKL
jgi:hypothetical protein